jgi:hypothetical protein
MNLKSNVWTERERARYNASYTYHPIVNQVYSYMHELADASFKTERGATQFCIDMQNYAAHWSLQRSQKIREHVLSRTRNKPRLRRAALSFMALMREMSRETVSEWRHVKNTPHDNMGVTTNNHGEN